MKHLLPINQRARYASSIVLLLGVSVLGWFFHPVSPRQQMLMNQQRWAARSFTNYRMHVQIESLGKTCQQVLEARGEERPNVLTDTCDTAWLSDLTVSELFDINERIDESASMHCYPSERFCTCRRVIARRVVYNAELGYPELLAYGRAMRPNWTHVDFWRRWITARSMPNCATPYRNIQIAVTALTPLP